MARPSNSDYGEDNGLSDTIEGTLNTVFSDILTLRIQENGTSQTFNRKMLNGIKTALRSVCAVRETTKTQNETLVQLHGLLESNDKEVKDQHKLLTEILGLTRELKKDMVQVESKVAMLASLLAENTLTLNIARNGVLLWEITGYKDKKEEAKSGERTSFYSDDFFSDSPHGYRMCARIYLNGDGVGKTSHLSIFFAVKKGKYDDILKWPFGLRVQFKLLNQNGGEDLSDAFKPDATSSSFKKPTRDMNIASGCPMFITQQVVETRDYLKNDKIWIKVIVGQ